MARKLATTKSARPVSTDSLPPSSFLSAFYANVLPADLAMFSPSTRTHIAASIWSLAGQRGKNETKLRIFNPSPKADGWSAPHTIIEIITDDMPFLVASVTGVLQRAGFAVHMVIHPIVTIARDAKGHVTKLYAPKDSDKDPSEKGASESFIHIQIDQCLDLAQLISLDSEVRLALADVRAAVEDWQPMRARMQEVSDQIDRRMATTVAGEDSEEIHAFLSWLCDNNFTFLGYREVTLTEKNAQTTGISVIAGRGLGILRDDDRRMFGGLRDMDEKRRPAIRSYVRQNHILFITKTNAITRVHRAVPMDAVFIRRFDSKGHVVSEHLFVGLFTSKTYTQTPHQIPFMRSKIAAVVARMGFAAKSHDGRILMHILNTYPHDELFQITEDELYANALGILQLQERARVALFPRRDPFGRFETCLIYVPRDRYDSALRGRIQTFLENAYQGKAQAWNVRIDDSRLARAFVTIHLTPDAPNPDPVKLENDLRDLCRTWGDRLRDSLNDQYGEAIGLTLLRRYGNAFPQTYREAITPSQALHDIRELERLRARPDFIATLDTHGTTGLTLKLFQPERPLSLSETLPMLENMGLKIDFMGGPYEITFTDGSPSIYIHQFVGAPAVASRESFERLKPVFEDLITQVWRGAIENDAFNALALRIGLDGRAIVVLRAFARYLRQLRIPYSHEMIAASLMAYPAIAHQLYALFYTRHNPQLKGDRAALMRAQETALQESLAQVQGLEDDRIIRRYLNLIQASLRTNFFQTDSSGTPKSYIAFKFDSRAVEFMPLPKPLYEIFVYSPQTEAVHLRGGKVARGGIRWSDRRDDFRAEILGLMKAQMVKNSVIVPVGSKGGFIVKRPPAAADKFQAEGIACYTVMMSGMLDITDNRIKNKIVPPANVVRHDGDDPYLVVAADKGTAKFSDIANAISQKYGFWLDDAFASGGSAGYDHKNMAITARGAWEAIKRHFREIGKDIQNQDFTCIGVGDMSGDVFGNGMLLSKHILLLGAFDHRHIFCDPSPNAATSFAERARLFDLKQSSWDDYNRKLISKGGGIFARSEKTIRLSAEMKKAYGTTADSLSPAELIQTMLKAEIELIYFGGIGTYVKASDESHEEVSDRATEALRVNGADLRAKVIGEGANLGMTQRGRIEYAEAGGRLNTDAIDNSAGVDTSDHEVNIKVLLRPAIDHQKMTIPVRNKLLASMTDDVGGLVLRDNYLQTQALSVAQAQAAELLPLHARTIQLLEKTGLLNRAVEYLPSDAVITERARRGTGLTRPELAVLLAYAKIWLYQKILDSDLPDDPAIQQDLADYFPKALRKHHADAIAHHQLRREIAATLVTNDIINRTGPHTVLTLAESHNIDPLTVVRAYWLARGALGLPDLWAAIDALDNKSAAATQTHLLLVLQSGLFDAIKRILAAPHLLTRLSASVQQHRTGLDQLGQWLARHPSTLTASDKQQAQKWRDQNVPESLAHRVTGFAHLVAAFDLVAVAAQSKIPLQDLAALFFHLQARLGLNWLARLPHGSQAWQREAAQTALADLANQHRRLTTQLSAKKTGSKKSDALQDWSLRHQTALARYDAMMAAGQAAGEPDLALVMQAYQTLAALTI